ncbi:hypothetical protein EVAR_6820_1 [Eumeta japonica]|uniref:Uncharacterized protein n=1 Tax=Eumeta variegata TaxID=151549 RepID=A0A4C1U6D3_EUMVA|nr:hypothetical protein EVAR_6820_1 [Eumeta japonica]
MPTYRDRIFRVDENAPGRVQHPLAGLTRIGKSQSHAGYISAAGVEGAGRGAAAVSPPIDRIHFIIPALGAKWESSNSAERLSRLMFYRRGIAGAMFPLKEHRTLLRPHRFAEFENRCATKCRSDVTLRIFASQVRDFGFDPEIGML